MAIGIKVCKVCGKEYEACHTLRPNLNSAFRWQDVACCQEHGQEYLRQIMISRGELPAEPEQKQDPVEEAPKAKRRGRKKGSVEPEPETTE